MGNQKNVLTLNSLERETWLTQHIPNRVGAAWVWLPGMKGEWKWKLRRRLPPAIEHGDFSENADRNQVWCICRVVEHGQKAAIRWLIEFVGVSLGEDGKPRRPANRDCDVSIQSFADAEDDLRIPLDANNPSSNARILARVWKGCSQSSVHPTDRTNHPRADGPQLAEAFQIIVEHLEEKLYRKRGCETLNQIVRSNK